LAFARNKVRQVRHELEVIDGITTPVSAVVQPEVAEWLRRLNRARRTPTDVVDVVNNGIVAACWRQLAFKFGAQVITATHEQVRAATMSDLHELPPMQISFEDNSDGVPYMFYATPGSWQYLRWMQTDRDVLPTVAVHDGLRILGRMALAGHDTIAIQHGRELEAKRLPVLSPDLPQLPPMPESTR
jgi:hypothetical protein